MTLPAGLKCFDSTNLRLRVMSALIMVPFALLAVYLGGMAFGALITCVVTLGLYEWLRLVAPQAKAQSVGMACAFLIVMMTAGALFSVSFGAILGVILTVALFLISRRAHDEQAWAMALGIPYMGGSGLALLSLREIPDSGAAIVLYLLLTVWATDIGAFFAGRLIGGAKLAPSISPSKTWSGLFGGMALALVVGYAVASCLGAKHPAVVLLLSPLLAAVAQMGDLFESYFKRRANVKESGDLIPGHGGILDRIDGLVFAGIFAALTSQLVNWW